MQEQPTGSSGDPVIRAAIYRRVSTDKQEREGTSLDEQERVGRELCDRDGFEVVDVYTDVLSGADPDREAYNRMLDDAIAARFDVIVISALDRFGRDVIQITTALQTLDAAGVRVVPVRGTIDRQSPEGHMMTTIEAAFAEFERAKIKIRTKSGIAAKVRKGIPHGVPRFGYATGEDLHWIVRPEEVELAERIFRLRVEDGLSYNAIAKRLNQQGARTRYGKRWSATQVRMIIQSEHTQGRFQHAGEWHDGRHEPIIDRDLWEAAQLMIGRDAKFTASRRGRQPRRHLFINGHLRCSVCHEPMHSRSGNTPDEDSYVCSTYRMHGSEGPHGCEGGWRKRTTVDAHFLHLFTSHWLDWDGTRQRMIKDLDRQTEDVAVQLAQADGALTQIEAQRTRADADYRAEELGAKAYSRLVEQLDDEQTAATAERDRLQAHAEHVREGRATIDAHEELVRRLQALGDMLAARVREADTQGDLETMRGVIASATDAVHVAPTGLITGIKAGARLKQAGRVEMPLSVAATNEIESSRTL